MKQTGGLRGGRVHLGRERVWLLVVNIFFAPGSFVHRVQALSFNSKRVTYPRESKIYVSAKTCAQMFTAALVIILSSIRQNVETPQMPIN